MKILSIGNFFNPSWDSSIPDEEHIAAALEELGHEVHRWQRNTTVDLWDATRTYDFDFILLAQWDGYPEYLAAEVKTTIKAPVIYWAFDYQADGQEWHERLVKEADLYLSKRIADSKYPNWQWLSQDFAPSFLDKYPERIERDIDVLFTGSYLPWAIERNDTLVEVDKKFNLVIHSVNEWPGWNQHMFKDVRPPIMDEGLPELYARAKIILSIDHTLEAGYWSDRVAQITACGGLVLHRYQPLCEARFKYVQFFYDIDSCLRKVGQALAIPEEDHVHLTQAAYLHAHRSLMVKHRVEDLLTIVGSIL